MSGGHKKALSKMSDIINDEIGRCFCKAHNREVCHICCMSFDCPNRLAEERAGLRKKRTEVEEAAEEKVTAMFALKGMEEMVPRPNEEVFKMNRKYLKMADEKLKRLEASGKWSPQDIQSAVEKAIDESKRTEIERHAMVQALSKQNPGKTKFELGGQESQDIYDQIISNPAMRKNRSEQFTCSYCSKSSTERLSMCARCKKSHIVIRNAKRLHGRLIKSCASQLQKKKYPKRFH